MISVDMDIGLDAKLASFFLKNSSAMVGQVTGITWTFPRRIHGVHFFHYFVYPPVCRFIPKRFKKITNYRPWFGTWGNFGFGRIINQMRSYGFDYHQAKKHNKEKRPKGLRK